MQYSAFARAVLQFYDKFVASVICHIEGIFLTINVTKLSQKGHIGPVRTAMQRNATAMRRMIVPMFVCALGAASPAMASEDTQHWETLTLNVALPDSFKLQSETVARTGDAKGFYEIEENVMVGKKLNKTVTVWLGYTFNPTYSHGTFQRREHRFRQQVNFDNVLVLGKAKVSGRMRLEERWREGLPGTGWRLRPQEKIAMPLVGKTTLTLSSEQFFNLNTMSFQKTSGLDRMRNAISIGMPLSKKVSVDVGYLNQHGFVRNGPDTSDHVLTLGLTASL